jgi:hypothetical protein
MKNAIKLFKKSFINFVGWSSKKRIVVIESDDWGSIRMSSKSSYDFFLENGVRVDKSNYTKYDCLESNDDIEKLFEVLYSIKDIDGSPAVITANAIVANPNFEKISKSNKLEYFFEDISETYKRYSNHDKVLDLWKKNGIADNVFYPQFHGREHFNVKKWMLALNSGLLQEEIAFNTQTLLGLSPSKIEVGSRNSFQYMAALEYNNESEKRIIENITLEGLDLFEKIFGFKSLSFVATAGIRGDHLDKTLFDNGVLYHQGGQQLIPTGNGNYKIKNRFWGDKNEFNQLYWRRNATFEPSRNQDFDWVDSCMSEINLAFKFNKPAVINTHRVNFIGGIEEKNRDLGLKKLNILLCQIVKKWPDVKFMNSAQLGNYISNSNF